LFGAFWVLYLGVSGAASCGRCLCLVDLYSCCYVMSCYVVILYIIWWYKGSYEWTIYERITHECCWLVRYMVQYDINIHVHLADKLTSPLGLSGYLKGLRHHNCSLCLSLGEQKCWLNGFELLKTMHLLSPSV
jgi:hypothetical protein